MHFEFLLDLVIVASVGVLSSLLLSRAKLPAVTGLLVGGAMIGPHGFSLVKDQHLIELFAEVGVVFLLFSVGLEFSLKRLISIGKQVAVGGSLQVGVTAVLTTGTLWAFGVSPPRAIFHGFVVSLASTALVLKALGERGEMDAPHGRFLVGALIFQDLCVVPMMLLVPVLSGKAGENPLLQAGLALGKAALVVLLVLGGARWLVPRLFDQVDRVRSREVFLLSVLAVCLGTAWLTSQVGLSLALGAFLAGIVMADSEYAHRALGDVMPLRDALTSFFFVSLGMLFEPRVLTERPLAVLGLFAALVLVKMIGATVASLAMRFPPRVAVVAGLGMAQFGEFGFVLLKAGAAEGLIDPETSRLLMAAALLSMVSTPLAFFLGPRLAAGVARLRALEHLLRVQGVDELTQEHDQLQDHVLVVGFGVAGQTLTEALKKTEIPYLILELNADTVRKTRAQGEPIYYGDASSEEALHHAHASRARAVVLMINDPDAAERAIATCKRVAPGVPIFLRTRYQREALRLRRLGADHLIIEEIETGLAALSRLLTTLNLSPELVLQLTQQASEKTQRVP